MVRVRRRTLLIALIAAIILLNPAVIRFSKDIIIETVMFPLKAVRAGARYLKSRNSCVRENIMLKEKAALLALEMDRLSGVIKENKRFKDLLGFREAVKCKSIAASVIGRSPSTWHEVVIIDKGQKQGIKKHMIVCTANGVVGTIAEASFTTSKVMLITDMDTRVGVILDESREMGVLTGASEGRCKVIYLGLDSEIKTGEKVVTSGLGGLYPKGLPIGEVAELGRDQIGLYRYAIVKPGQDLNTFEEVICVE
ncbi:MAG: rod shape-determining protein MreC [Candidatus Omnitrophota bacterium]